MHTDIHTSENLQLPIHIPACFLEPRGNQCMEKHVKQAKRPFPNASLNNNLTVSHPTH